jgi:hypothetical protein
LFRHNLGKAIAEALDQLEGAFERRVRPRQIGVIALDLSRIIDRTHEVATFPNRDLLHQWTNSTMPRLVQECAAHAPTKMPNRNLHLVIRVRMAAYVASDPPGEPTCCESLVSTPVGRQSERAARVMRDLLGRVSQVRDPRSARPVTS